MATYAKTTTVTPEESRQEIQAILRRYGATAFVYGWDSEANQSVFSFRLGNRSVRMNVPMPTTADRAVARTESGKTRTKEQAQTALDQAIRARWRAMTLFIKAALEAVEIGAITLDEAFLAGTLLPNNQTVKEWAGPQLDKFAAGGQMPPLLPAPLEERQ